VSVEWKDLVSEVREMAKEAEDFTNRLYILASTIQRKGRDFETEESTRKMVAVHRVSLEELGNEREPGTTRIAGQDSRDTQEKE